MKGKTLFILILAGSQLCMANGAAFARDCCGAIAVSDSGAYGYSHDFPTRAQAESFALRECGDGDREVEVWYRNACGAVAMDDEYVGSSWADTRVEAEAEAIADRGTGACEVLAWACTSRS